MIPHQKDALQLEQAYALLLTNDFGQAFDILAEMLTRKPDPANEFLAQAYCGLIRHSQWACAVRTASTQSQAKAGAAMHRNVMPSSLLSACSISALG